MLTSGINFINFKKKNSFTKIKKKLLSILSVKNHIIDSLGTGYNYSFKKKDIQNYKKFNNFRVIGMGGSTLGTQTIYEFLNHKIKKKIKKKKNI